MANIESPLAGKILAISVNVGDQVAEDDEVLIIEAMKMENPVYSETDGVVKEIKVKVGDRVEEGVVLIVLE